MFLINLQLPVREACGACGRLPAPSGDVRGRGEVGNCYSPAASGKKKEMPDQVGQDGNGAWFVIFRSYMRMRVALR